MKDKILELLAANTPQVVVASAVGVSESYISQLVSDPAFAEELQAKKLEKLAGSVRIDNKYDSMEDKLMDKLDGMIPYMTKTGDIVRALQVANAAKRRTAGATNNAVTHNTYVSLNLPALAKVQFTMNKEAQVIDVAGRSLATLPSNQVTKMVTGIEDTSTRDKEMAKDRLSKIKVLENLQVFSVMNRQLEKEILPIELAI